MPKPELSDKEITAEAQRSWRAIATMTVSFFILCVAGILLLGAGEAHLIPMWLVNVLGAALLLGWVVLMFTRVRPGIAPPDEAFDEDYLRRTIDLQHRRWRYITFFMLLYVFANAGFLTDAISNGGYAFLRQHAFLFAYVALIASMSVAYGPGFVLPYYRRALNDERMRAQQGKVAQFGYNLAILAMCGVLVAATYEPQWAIPALPLVVTAVITVPAIYSLILEWRASRDG